jgi:hypothetical protein
MGVSNIAMAAGVVLSAEAIADSAGAMPGSATNVGHGVWRGQ